MTAANRRQARDPWTGVALVLGLIWLVLSFYPVLYLVFTSFRTQATYISGQTWFPPLHPTLANYASAWEAGFARAFLNSAVVSLGALILILLTRLMAAYAITRMQSKFSNAVFTLLLAGLAIPAQAAIIPLYLWISHIGLYNTYLALILPSVGFAMPLTVLVFSNFLRDIPSSLFDAMMIDGAGSSGIFWRLVVPLSRPALTAMGIYNFIQVWNNFLFPLVLTQGGHLTVLPLALQHFEGAYTMNVPGILAAVTLSAIPLIVAYIVGRRQLLSGITAGFGR